jgi:hypothetical protein
MDDETLFRQMERVRFADNCPNMIDRNGVMAVANQLNCYDLVTYLAEMEGRGGRTSPEGRVSYMDFLNRFGAWLDKGGA